jgi:hypothetical protein
VNCIIYVKILGVNSLCLFTLHCKFPIWYHNRNIRQPKRKSWIKWLISSSIKKYWILLPLNHPNILLLIFNILVVWHKLWNPIWDDASRLHDFIFASSIMQPWFHLCDLNCFWMSSQVSQVLIMNMVCVLLTTGFGHKSCLFVYRKT